MGAISLSKAAELLDLSYQAFFVLLGRKGLSFVNASAEEADESYRAFETLMQRQ